MTSKGTCNFLGIFLMTEKNKCYTEMFQQVNFICFLHFACWRVLQELIIIEEPKARTRSKKSRKSSERQVALQDLSQREVGWNFQFYGEYPLLSILL